MSLHTVELGSSAGPSSRPHSRQEETTPLLNGSLKSSSRPSSRKEATSRSNTPRPPSRSGSRQDRFSGDTDAPPFTPAIGQNGTTTTFGESPNQPSKTISCESDEIELIDSHCHDDVPNSGVDKRARRKLIIATLLCLVFMAGEVVGGFLAQSLALKSDAAHLLTDFASYLIAILALHLGQRRSSKSLNFGWHRIEILGALLSILLLWVITGVLCYSAALRIMGGKYEIEATIMLITAGCGVFFNVVQGFTLNQTDLCPAKREDPEDVPPSPTVKYSKTDDAKINGFAQQYDYNVLSYSEEPPVDTQVQSGYGSIAQPKKDKDDDKDDKKGDNINVKAAFIHVLGDLVQSVGVLVAAFIIYYKPNWKIADPICTFMFSGFVIVTTITILRDLLLVLMEGKPKAIEFNEVRKSFYEVQGVKDVHNLRIWSLTMDKVALSVHIAIDKYTDPLIVTREATSLMQKRYDIAESTMQIEAYTSAMVSCKQCQHLKN